MIAVLLVAGYATRLYPLTINTPKPLLPVAGRAMLDYIADELDTLPDLTGICLISNHRFASHFEAWAVERNLINYEKIFIMRTMGWSWLRSGSVIQY